KRDHLEPPLVQIGTLPRVPTAEQEHSSGLLYRREELLHSVFPPVIGATPDAGRPRRKGAFRRAVCRDIVVQNLSFEEKRHPLDHGIALLAGLTAEKLVRATHEHSLPTFWAAQNPAKRLQRSRARVRQALRHHTDSNVREWGSGASSTAIRSGGESSSRGHSFFANLGDRFHLHVERHFAP